MNTKEIVRLKAGVKTKINELWIEVMYENCILKKTPSIFNLLEVFSSWISIEEGMHKLTAKGSKDDFFIFSLDLNDLLKNGFLETKGISKNSFGFNIGKFDSFPVHVRMLNDTTRTNAYRKAIKDLVNNDDIVLDIGTGNGILAATAAMCGAKHVYAIERTEFIEVAREVFKANGIEDKITLIKGDSKKIELPEKATVLVSEIIGNDPFDEGILETYKDAKKRLLTPNAKIIPQNIKVVVEALETPQEKYSYAHVSNTNIETWKKNYGVDFSSFLKYIEPYNLELGHNNNKGIKECLSLAPAMEVANVDLQGEIHPVIESRHNFTITQNGNLNAMHVSFETTLSINNILSVRKDEVSLNNSWALKIFYLGKELPVKEGDAFKLYYSLVKQSSILKLERALT